MKPELLEYFYLRFPQLLVKLFALLGGAKSKHFDLAELVHPIHTSRGQPCCSSLGSEAVSETHQAQWQLLNRNDRVHVHASQRYFSGADERQVEVLNLRH